MGASGAEGGLGARRGRALPFVLDPAVLGRTIGPDARCVHLRRRRTGEVVVHGDAQQQGRTLPATVTHATNNCWRFEIEYNTFHRQTWNWCARDGRLVEQGGSTHQQFDFVAFKVDENSTVAC